MKKIRDYCTAVPDGHGAKHWGKACKIHDHAYYLIKETRKQADLEFYHNMTLYSWGWVAKLYYWGVRLFGRLFV